MTNTTSTTGEQSIDDPASFVNYFAIGSMMNPVSMANRGVRSIHSEPAELLDHRLEFFSSMGFADAVEEPGSSFHGVIHKVHHEDMAILDEIEQYYQRKDGTARLYDGTSRAVQVYSRLAKDPGDVHLPGERYIDVLVEGAEHYGVKTSHIEWLRTHDKVPRPSRDEFLAFDDPTDKQAAVATVSDVERNDGLEGRPFWICVNGKVLAVSFPSELAGEMHEYTQRWRSRGQVMELFLGQLVYDPKFGVIKAMDDVTPDYCAWCEHFMVQYLTSQKHLSFFKVVAKLN